MTIFPKKPKKSDKSLTNDTPPAPVFRNTYDPEPSFAYLERFFILRVEEDLRRFGQRYMMRVDHPAIQSRVQMMFGNFEDSMRLASRDQATRYSQEMIARLVSGFFDGMATWIRIAKDELKFTDILKIQDIEQRMVALKRYGAEKVLHDAKAELIDKSTRGNELYLIPVKTGIFSTDAYYLKYSDPSTGRIYISGVPPEMGITKSADACMAWKHGLAEEAYQMLQPLITEA